MKCSAAAARRDASVSPSNCPANTPAPKGELGFPRDARLTRGDDLQTVIREGKRIRTVHLDVRAVASPRARSRVGIVVPKHQHSVVDRNRLKRRLRELARTELLPRIADAASVDVVIRARHEAYGAAFAALGADVRIVADRLAGAAETETKA
ncbi:MAG: ribonuclease P protein component [Gemmatimonadales bacterium]